MVLKKIRKFLETLVLKERNPNTLALSFCLGVFIAFSPFICFHSALIILFCWLFSLNLAVAFASTWLVNNPWTMVPVYWTDYVFGNWFLRTFLGIDPVALNPTWMNSLNRFICSYTGISGLSFWGFMIGGNLLGILVSIILYPIVKIIFKRVSCRIDNFSPSQKMVPNESHCSE